MAAFTPSQRGAAVRVLLARSEGARAFLDAVERGDATLSELALDQKQSLLDNPQRQLARRTERLLSKTGGLPNPDRQKVIDELKEITLKAGNAAAGKEVFKQQCSKCHMHSGEGNRIGPDLTGMAVHPKEELLVHILDPSRSVEGNYRAYSVATADGQVINGLLASESKTALEFFDSEGKRRTVQREDIEQFVASTKSLMPEGFEKQVTREAIGDLLEFLTVVRDPAAGSSQRKGGPDYRGISGHLQNSECFVERRRDAALGHRQTDALHRVAELPPILRHGDRTRVGTDQLDVVFVEHAPLRQLHRDVQRRLPPHGGQ